MFSDITKKCEFEAYKLGLNPDEFWNMIPRDFFIWQKAKLEILKMKLNFDKNLTGLICSTIANFAAFKKSKKYKIEDFVGKERKIQTEQEMLNQVKKINAMYGGVVKSNGSR